MIDDSSDNETNSPKKASPSTSSTSKSKNSKLKKTFTITFGDQAENHVGMQKLGKLLKEGFNIIDIENMFNVFREKGYDAHIYVMKDLLEDAGIDQKEIAKTDDATILVVRNGLKYFLDGDTDAFFKEQDDLEKDTKAKMYGRVVDKHARHNLCFADKEQKADFEKGMGTVVSFSSLPLLQKVREKLGELCEKCENLVAEGNYYYDISKCGIGYHGDSERRIVIGIRLGESMPLHFRWYHEGEIVSPTLKLVLNNGDMYFSSQKATGFDWKLKKTYTLRHAAGSEKFVDTKHDILPKKKDDSDSDDSDSDDSSSDDDDSESESDDDDSDSDDDDSDSDSDDDDSDDDSDSDEDDSESDEEEEVVEEKVEEKSPEKKQLEVHEFDKVSGLFYIPNVIDSSYAKDLIKNLDEKGNWVPLSDSQNSRKVQHYGYKYDYKKRSVYEKADPIPDYIQPLANKLKRLSGKLELIPENYDFNQVIINNYEPGQSISAHIDVKDYGKVIGCYTIGSGSTMRFTKDDEENVDVYVQPNSLYVMSGDARYKWKHEMVAAKTDKVGGDKVKRDRRVSITFRNVPLKK